MKDLQKELNSIIKNFNSNFNLIIPSIKKNDKLLKNILNNTSFLNIREQEKGDKRKFKVTLTENIFVILNDIMEVKTCSECNEYVAFDSFKNGYKLFCSVKCSKLSKITQDKYKQTNIDRYGVDNPMKLKSTIDKIKETNIDRYGVDSPMKSKDIKDKTKQTNIGRYGVDNPMKSQDVKNKYNEIISKKYGNDIENISQINSVKAKKKEKIYQNIYQNKIMNFEKTIKIKPLFSLKDYNGVDKYYDWKCLKCNNEFSSNIDDGSIPLCPKCSFNFSYSNLEKELFEFINKNSNEKVLENQKRIITPYEIDILIKEKNIAFEFDGLYYHRYSYLLNKKNEDIFKKFNFSNKGKYYHLLKTELAKEKGIKLYHIFEDEWLNKKDIVKSIVLNKLNISKYKLNGRDCYIKEVENSIKNNFLNQNHLQGEDKSKIKIGLFLKKDIYENNQLLLKKDELVSLMTFGKPRYNKKSNFELIRFCNLLNFNVRGSASKIFKYFIDNFMNKGDKTITYSDLRYSNGELYEKLGFDFTHKSEPNYFYIKNNIRISRINFQKHKIEKYFINNKFNITFFDKNLSEWENMQLNNYDKIYDCGNLAFEYVK